MPNVLDHPVIRELQDAKIAFLVKGNEVELDGFAKSGTAILTYDPLPDQFITEPGVLYIKTRYNKINDVNNLNDIVVEAFYWYLSWVRFNGDGCVSPIWKDHFIKAGFIKNEQTITEKVVIL